MRATAIGAACARSWCSSRAAVRTSAIIAASAASGRAGATATRCGSPGSSRACTASMACKRDQFRRREPDRLEEGLARVPRSADRRECRPDPGRIDARRRHRARCRHPASLQAGGLGALPARPGEHRRAHARAHPQGRHGVDRSRGDPADAPARHPVDGDLGGRLRGGDRPRPLARPAPAPVLRSRPDPDALRHAAPLDALFRARRRPSRDPARPPALGLQASGAGDPAHAAVARAALVQVHRDGAAMPAEGALAHVPASRPRPAPRHALVQPDGPARLAVRDPQFPVRPAAEGRSVGGGILGRAAARRGGSDVGRPARATVGVRKAA